MMPLMCMEKQLFLEISEVEKNNPDLYPPRWKEVDGAMSGMK